MISTSTQSGRPALNVLSVRVLVLVTLFGAVAALAGCTPAVSAPPRVMEQPSGRGTVAGMELAPSAGCRASERSDADTGQYPGSGAAQLHMMWQGRTRSASLRLPKGFEGPRPVIVSLHPFTLTPAQWESYAGVAAAGTARGYVVLSPLGSAPGPRWAVPGGLDTGVDDIGFISALLDHLEDHLCIDRNREFAAGYSAGAAMAQALSCATPWRFSAVAGSGGVNLTDLCPDSPGTDVFVMHGSADPIAPLSGSKVIFAPPLGLSVSDVVATNARRAGCDPDPELTSPVAHVSSRTYQHCNGRARVSYWLMNGAGHTWAGAAPVPFDLVVGRTLESFSATTAVLDFFDAA